MEKLPEVQSELPPGILAEIWRDRSKLETIKASERLRYFVSEGVRSVIALPITSAVAIITIAASIFLLVGGAALLANIDDLITRAGSTLNVSVYLKDGVPDGEIKALETELKGQKDLQSVEFISKKAALASFRSSLGPRASVLTGLEDENPLPASFEIEVRGEGDGHEAAQALVASLRKHLIVADVVHGSEWLAQLERGLAVFRFVSSVVAIFVVGIVCFLVFSTTKLIMYARRDEIEIMQLVGAPTEFVRFPFLIGTAIQGFLGAALGVVGGYFAFALVRSYVHGSGAFGALEPAITFVSAPTLMLFIIGAVTFAVISGLTALQRFMDA
ncbi:MAG: ABC transporter permease [Deltaproteobacteria bacterium]|nr:ABC transporter permease [Deltaproteobacteria bacterium]